MFKPDHFGLYFTPIAVETAASQQRKEPFKVAFAALDTLAPTHPLETAVLDGFRYRFNGDEQAAQRATSQLIEHGIGLNIPMTDYVEQCAMTMAVGHVFEMVRDTLPTDAQRGWQHVFEQQVEQLRSVDDSELPLLAFIWRAAMKITTAVVLERSDIFVLGVDDFKRVVENEIHPEGYMPALVQNSDGGALARQVLAAQGLALAAEAATHVGSNLWAFDVRGISAKTTATYAAAYFEYRDTWKWDEPPTEEDNDTLYRSHSGFFEMLNMQLGPEVLRQTMDKLRPVFDPYGGGLTTLSHGVVRKRGLFGF